MTPEEAAIKDLEEYKSRLTDEVIWEAGMYLDSAFLEGHAAGVKWARENPIIPIASSAIRHC